MASNYYLDTNLLSGYPDNMDICFSPSTQTLASVQHIEKLTADVWVVAHDPPIVIGKQRLIL